MIVAYVSGHGYGHATRTAEVLRVVRALAPGQPLAIVSQAPAWLFEQALPGGFELRPRPVDVGLAQHGALSIDEAGTAARWREFAAGLPARVREEAAWLRSVGARAVLGDVPPLAFAAAAEAGVRSVAVANFSWDWIYRHLGGRQPILAEAAEEAAR
ncbi:MAG TPA: glycosyl transferase, partial [Vicinamibacteria bacterium]